MTFYYVPGAVVDVQDNLNVEVKNTTTFTVDPSVVDNLIITPDQDKTLVVITANCSADTELRIYYSPDGENFDTIPSQTIKIKANNQATTVVPVFWQYIKIDISSSAPLTLYITTR